MLIKKQNKKELNRLKYQRADMKKTNECTKTIYVEYSSVKQTFVGPNLKALFSDFMHG